MDLREKRARQSPLCLTDPKEGRVDMTCLLMWRYWDLVTSRLWENLGGGAKVLSFNIVSAAFPFPFPFWYWDACEPMDRLPSEDAERIE